MYSVADLREGPGCPSPLNLGRKEEITEGRKAGMRSKIPPPPLPLSSRSGSTTGII